MATLGRSQSVPSRQARIPCQTPIAVCSAMLPNLPPDFHAPFEANEESNSRSAASIPMSGPAKYVPSKDFNTSENSLSASVLSVDGVLIRTDFAPPQGNPAKAHFNDMAWASR